MPKLVQDIADKVMMNSSSYGINISQDNRNVNSNYMQNNSEYTHRKNKFSDNENIQKKKTKNKYSISYNKDGSPAYVEITENIFIGHKGENANKVIRNYLKQHIGEYAKIIESGQKIYLGKDLPGEYVYSKSSLKNIHSIRSVKNQASQNSGEMIEIARRWEKTIKINITNSLDTALNSRYGDRKAIYKRLF